MLVRITCAFFLVLLLPLTAMAQEPKTVDDLDKEISELRIEISKLKELITQAGETATENKGSIEQMQNEIKQDLSDLTDIVQEQATRREAFKPVLEEGEVVIHNKMSSEQQIKVNQSDYTIGAGETLTLRVPTGTLTAQLPGQALTNWTITAPKYYQKIDIVPNERTVTANRLPTESSTVTALRPLETTVTTLRPLYTAPPVYMSPVVTSYYVDPFTGYWYPW